LGIDVGTTAIKMVLVADDGSLLGSWSMEHSLESPETGFAEERTDIWKAHLFSLLSTVVKETKGIVIESIGLTGMVPTLVMVDSKGNALYPSIQQNDIRSGAEIEELKEKLGEDWFFQRTGAVISQQSIFPKLLWMKRHHPELFSHVSQIMGSYDYLSLVLTGVPHVERNWALESGMYDILKHDWISEVLQATGIERSLLPPVFAPASVVGTTTKEIEETTLLPQGIPVVAGSADHVASSFCIGVRKPGDLVFKLGGAADILLATDTLVTDKRLFIDYGCSSTVDYLINGCTATSGSMLKWFAKELSLPDYAEMDKLAASVAPGSEGVVVLPYFLGEKTPIFDIHAKGVIYGLTLHHTRTHIYRAMLEAVAYSFYHHVEVFQSLSLPIKRVFITNGGSRSTLWRQIIADCTGHDVQYVHNNVGSCLGAALLGGMGTGNFSEATADLFLSDISVNHHDPALYQVYQQSYRQYRALYAALRPLFQKTDLILSC